MVDGQSVAVEWVKADRYGRKVGKVLLAGQDANLVQVEHGTTSNICKSNRLLTKDLCSG